HGGFQHGQAYPPQGDSYAQQQPQYGQQHQQQPDYSQGAAYGQGTHATGDPNQQYPADPNAPEGERGLLGAIGGGLAGGMLGGKANHGFLGTIAGAIAGSKAEDAAKARKHSPKPPQYGGSQYGGSSHSGHHHGKREAEW
ncbi:hypothetical protein LTR53_016093, partial [Teratosphaeriaceae sp. CCFEE 6253]